VEKEIKIRFIPYFERMINQSSGSDRTINREKCRMAADMDVEKRSPLLEGLQGKTFDVQRRFFSTLSEDDVRDITFGEYNEIFCLKYMSQAKLNF
jgi:hypothetical protein